MQSATQIVLLGSTFEYEIDLPPEELARLRNDAAHGVISSVQPAIALLSELPVARFNPGSTVDDYLKEHPDLAQLLGAQGGCDCEHCQSVLSPAAYFVDLMDLIEERILVPNQTRIHTASGRD